MVKDGAAPGIGGVAGRARCSERTQVYARFRVAGVTRLGDILEDTMLVAFVARQSDVCTSELKVCEVVVKGSLSPVISPVALGTILPQLPVVRVVFSVARGAGTVHFLIAHLAMTVSAGQGKVGAGQRKVGVCLVTPLAQSRIADQRGGLFSRSVGSLAVTLLA